MKFVRGLLLFGALAVGSPGIVTVQAQVFGWSTIAGLAGTYGSADGTNDTAWFWQPVGVAVDINGNVYVDDSYNVTIRKLARQGTNWVVTTIAGLANRGGYADGTNSDIEFSEPNGIAMDSKGNLYVVDTGPYTIRKLTPMGTNWVSSTIAGQAGTGPGTVDGTNNASRFCSPYGVAVGSDDSVYVADSFNHTIRKLTQVGTNWVSSTIAGLGRASGFADGTNSAARFYYPYGIGADHFGNVYVADSGNNTIRKLTPVGTNWVTTTIAGLAHAAGYADGTNNAARFYNPYGVTADSAGNVYVADTRNYAIRQLTPVGTNWVTSTIGGSGTHTGGADGLGSAARFGFPWGIAIDNQGVFCVADTGNNNLRQGVGLPLIQGMGHTNGVITFTWGAVVGQTFQIQYATDLAQTSWTILGSPVTATNAAVWWGDNIGGDTQWFYRIKVLLPE